MLKIVNLLQVTRSVDTDHGQLSAQEKKTVEAIVKAR
jgi:E3 ubiquitin-protein ligase RGLG